MEEVTLRIEGNTRTIQWRHEVIKYTSPISEPPIDASQPEHYGQVLYDTYLRGTLFEKAALSSNSLALRIYDSEQNHTWELLHDGNKFLALQHGISRLPSNRFASATMALNRPPLRVLVTTNLEADVNYKSQLDAIEIMFHRWERADSMVEITTVRNPSRMRWIRTMDDALSAQKPFHIWHYVGQQIDNNTLQLAESTIRFDQINSLLDTQTDLRGIVLDLVGTPYPKPVNHLKVPFVLMPHYPLDRESATLFFHLFYENLWDKGITEAALLARQKLYSYTAEIRLASAIAIYHQGTDDRFTLRSPQPSSIPEKERIRDQVFVSYSHQDEAWCNQLMSFLEPLSQTHVIKTWVDKDIEVGSDWFDSIQKALEQAKVAVLLASPAFFRSKFIQTHELPYILEQRNLGNCTVIWVAVSAYPYELTPLASIQAVHPTNEPLDRISKHNAEDVLFKIVRLVAAALNGKDTP